MTKVTFIKQDEVLAAAVRALAGKAAGRYSVVSGMTDKKLHDDGYYTFQLTAEQHQKFKLFVETYISEQFRNDVDIIDVLEKSNWNGNGPTSAEMGAETTTPPV